MRIEGIDEISEVIEIEEIFPISGIPRTNQIIRTKKRGRTRVVDSSEIQTQEDSTQKISSPVAGFKGGFIDQYI